MKVEISIKDDRELKDHIRDVIKGEVVSIARGEIRHIIKQVFGEKYGSVIPEPDKIIREELKEIIRKDIGVGTYGNSDFIREIARQEAIKMVRESISKGI